MVAHYMPLVHALAEQVHRSLPSSVDLESLIHSGVVGLLDALERFEPQRGVEFKVFARYRIYGEVMEFLRTLDWASRSVRSWERRIGVARVKLAGEFLREPVAEEMAQELGLPLETYFRIDQQVNNATLLNIEQLAAASEAEWNAAQEKFSRPPFIDPLNLVETKDLLTKLASAVEKLTERERIILSLYYHEDRILKEIGEILGLSESRVSQIVGRIVRRLRDVLGIHLRLKRFAPTKGAARPRKEQNMKLRKERSPMNALGDALLMCDGLDSSAVKHESEVSAAPAAPRMDVANCSIMD